MGNKNAKGIKREESARNARKKNKNNSNKTNNGKASGGNNSKPRPARSSEVARLSESENISLGDFTLMTTVGKGSFGKVIQVRKKDSGEIFAMKVLKKDHVVKRKQIEHTMTERRILENIHNNGATILMASHNYNLIKGRGRRIIELKDGLFRGS